LSINNILAPDPSPVFTFLVLIDIHIKQFWPI